MLFINKITSSSVVDYAAEELKKYIYMMMPEDAQVTIAYAPLAKEGFRVGLMEDMGLNMQDVECPDVDDAIYIDCTAEGGIIAGSNPRSVLIAVYEYLRQNGCRWLFPGIDGEYIPVKNVGEVKYRHVATSRYRGPCIEGAISQQILIDTIEFLPKVGMNLFMMQFFVPTPFFNDYYRRRNSKIQAPEPVSVETILQWKRAAECEIAKRGLQFYDIGHGWTAAPFNIDCSSAWDAVDESIVPKESIKYLAEVKGRRGLHKSRVLNTQFCMSSTEARERVCRYVTDYAKKHTNVDCIMFSLADSFNNHCECEACRAKTVSDWYVILLNEVDAAFTKEGIDTKLAFCTYTETTWAPVTEKLINTDRFLMEIAPITRKYTESATGRRCETVPFERNNIKMPSSIDEYMEYVRQWDGAFGGRKYVFEYHFWKHQVFDLSGQKLALRIFEDSEAYSSLGVEGMIGCGSQRAYFPNGFAYYVFARKQFDAALTFDEIKEDYYSHAYGEDWKRFYDYLAEIEEAISFAYLEGECSEDRSISPFYNRKVAENMKNKIPEILARGKELISEHYNSDYRVRTVSVRLLDEHAEYVSRLARTLYFKAINDDESALREAPDVLEFISAREPFTDRYFDMNMNAGYIKEILSSHGEAKVQVLNL